MPSHSKFLKFLAYIVFGFFLGSAAHNAFIGTDNASLRMSVMDLTVCVVFLFIILTFELCQIKQGTK